MKALLSFWIAFLDLVGFGGILLLFAVMIFTVPLLAFLKALNFYSDKGGVKDRGVGPTFIMCAGGGFATVLIVAAMAELFLLRFWPEQYGAQISIFAISVCLYLLELMALSWLAGGLEWLEEPWHNKLMERIRGMGIFRRRASVFK